MEARREHQTAADRRAEQTMTEQIMTEQTMTGQDSTTQDTTTQDTSYDGAPPGWRPPPMRTMDEWDPSSGWSTEEIDWYVMGPFEGGVPGLVRRVRRILDVSQRGLAALIGVSQSAVARWETGRTSPRVCVLQRLMRLAGLRSTVSDVESGEVVEPMRDDGARDRGGRRYPAHVDLRVTGWYVPRGLDCTAEAGLWRRRSRARKDPRIRHHTSPYRRWCARRALGTPIDHPADFQLVAEAEHLDEKRSAALAAYAGWSPPRAA
jgi:HTH-type transcriptional regulator/antitoxin HipB